MAEGKTEILVVDDDASICESLKLVIENDSVSVVTTQSPKKGLELIQQKSYPVVIHDIKMDEMDGITFLGHAKKISPNSMYIAITAFSTWDRAVDAMRNGVFAYIRKPISRDEIIDTVSRALKGYAARKESVSKFTESHDIIFGISPKIQSLLFTVEKAARSDATVLITGETGTGKELIAKLVHAFSPRAEKMMVTVNCSAMPETLLESELFGHVHGAFTTAVADKSGIVEVANGGTLFLDEIGEMPLSVQPKILRLLENREYRPVGSPYTKKCDIRIIAATNKNLHELSKVGTFREDLFYRLNVIPIQTVPLRERPDDIPVLADYFLRKYCAILKKNIKEFSADARKKLVSFGWPGNVRELDNIIQRAVVMADSDRILPEDLMIEPKQKMLSSDVTIPDAGFDLDSHLEEIEKQYIRAALAKANGNITKAAELLKLSMSSFRYKLQKYNITDGEK